MKKYYLVYMFIVNFSFAQKTTSIIGFVSTDNTSVYSIPDSNNKYLKFRVNKIDTIEIYDTFYDNITQSTFFWIIKYKGQKGFIPNYYISQSSELTGLKLALDEKYKLKEKELDSIRFTELKKMWGGAIANRIIKKEYWIGMTAEMCRKSLGFPDNINSSVGSWGTHEQWVYRKPLEMYLYFENGKLTSYQY